MHVRVLTGGVVSSGNTTVLAKGTEPEPNGAKVIPAPAGPVGAGDTAKAAK